MGKHRVHFKAVTNPQDVPEDYTETEPETTTYSGGPPTGVPMGKGGMDNLCETIVVGTDGADRSAKLAALAIDPIATSSNVDIPRRILAPVQQDPALDDHRYAEFALLGTGGEGAVYSALDRTFDREIAIKVSRTATMEDAGKMARFIQEARVTASLEHPNILPIHDIDITSDGRTYFTMRKSDGDSLQAVLEAAMKDPQNPPDIIATYESRVSIIDQVSNAVSYAHAQGIIHQDIKPANIMLGSHGEVVVVDWGTALNEDDRAEIAASAKKRIMGTPVYMSPEQARRESVDERSDVYCLGATFYHLLTFTYPTWSENSQEFWEMKRAGDLSETPSLSANVPIHLLSIALKALAPDPEDRYTSVQEFQNALRLYRDHRESIRLTEKERERSAEAGDDVLVLADIAGSLTHALELWPENNAALQLRKQVREHLLVCALEREDLPLARETLEQADGDLVQYQERVLNLEKRLVRYRRQEFLRKSAVIVAIALVAVLGVILWRENQRTVGQWYEVYAHEFTGGDVGALTYEAGMRYPPVAMPSENVGSDGLKIVSEEMIWFPEEVDAGGSIRVYLDISWDVVDGFEVGSHAVSEKRPGPWWAARGYSAQFAGYKGTVNYTDIRHRLTIPNLPVGNYYKFVPKQRYQLVYEYDNDYLSLSVDGEEIHRHLVTLKVQGPKSNRLWIRSWGEAVVHSVRVERKAEPLYASPLLAGDALAGHGHWNEAAEQYRSIARQYPGERIAAQALLSALDAGLLSDDGVSDDEFAERIAQIELLGFDEYTARSYELYALRLWNQRRFQEALAYLPQVFEESPQTTIASRLMVESPQALPPDIGKELLSWVTKA